MAPSTCLGGFGSDATRTPQISVATMQCAMMSSVRGAWLVGVPRRHGTAGLSTKRAPESLIPTVRVQAELSIPVSRRR